MRKYWQIFKIMLLSKLEYRFEMFSMFINELIGVVGVTILWNSIFQNSSTIGGLTREQTIIYYVILPLVGLFTSVSISGQLGDEVKNGQFSKYLLRPYRLRFGLFFSSLAEKIHMLVLVLPIYLIGIFVFVRLYNYQSFTLENLILGIGFSLLGFLLHFLLDANISWLAFWLNDVWAFQHFKDFTFSIFGGINFPLNFLGGTLRKVFEFLPFKYFYYVPVGYLMGIRSAANISQDLIGIFIWAVCFAVGGQLLFLVGLKKFEAYGN